MEFEESYDFLVCMSIETTEGGRFQDMGLDQYVHRFLYAKEEHNVAPHSFKSEEFPNIIEIDWCAYDLSKQLVTEEHTYFVKPENMEALTSNVSEHSGILKSDLENASSLSEVLMQFNKFAYESFILKNYSFCICTFGDWPLMRQLTFECYYKQIKLAPHFDKFFNLHKCFSEFSPHNKEVKSLSEMIQVLKLKERRSNLSCISEYQAIVRIINRLAKDSFKFIHPSERRFRILDVGRERSRSRNRSPELVWNKRSFYYAKISNLPWKCAKPDIKEFLHGLSIHLQDIAFRFSFDGKFLREAVIRLLNKTECLQCLSFNKRIFGAHLVEVVESNYKEMMEAEECEKQHQLQLDGPSYNPNDLVGLRMRGLPFSVSVEDIQTFFSGLNYVIPNSIKIGYNASGKKSGEATLLFKTKEDMEAAHIERHGQSMGHRWIELFAYSFEEYERFESKQKQSHENNMKNYVGSGNTNNCISLQGLPFSVTEEEICQFFSGFNLKKSDVFIERKHGRATGNGLVILSNRNEAMRAKSELHMKYIGKRYIEISLMND